MASEFLRIGGRSEAGIAKAIKTDDEGNVGIQLVRSKSEIAEEILEIRDTNEHMFDLPQCEKDIFEQGWFFFNTTKQSINIKVQLLFMKPGSFNPIHAHNHIIDKDISGSKFGGKLSVLPDVREESVYTVGELVRLPELSMPVWGFRLRVKADVAPTEGSLTCLIQRRY